MTETTPSIPGDWDFTNGQRVDLADALEKCEAALAWYDLAWRSMRYAGWKAARDDVQKARRELMGAIVRLEPMVGDDG